MAAPGQGEGVAIDPEVVQKDMYLAEVGDLDRRIVRDGWTYYIHAVTRPGRLGRPPLTSNSLLGDLLLVAPIDLFLDWRARRRPWTIGVVRFGYVGGWNDQTPKVIHRETLEDGVDPSTRIAELAADVTAGRFDPATS
jgi:hypothetical protein